MTTQAPDLAGLCERLRAKAWQSARPNNGSHAQDHVCFQAAAAIESLVAENERMREALKLLDAYLYATCPDSNEAQIVTRALEGASDDR